MNTDLWLGLARERLRTVPVNTTFILKDLFDGVKWKELPTGDRLGLGKSFKNRVLNGELSGIKYNGKRDNNSAEYIRVS